ncbi:MAG: G1 family glutamic endopeptidase, partial [Acidimicrobiales bacterium]
MHTDDLLQAGTEQDWSPQGVVYYAWYELVPTGSFYLGAVYPGDHISVVL